jgi:hypothetical protein
VVLGGVGTLVVARTALMCATSYIGANARPTFLAHEGKWPSYRWHANTALAARSRSAVALPDHGSTDCL